MNGNSKFILRGFYFLLLEHLTHNISFPVVIKFTLDLFNKQAGIVTQIPNGHQPPILVSRERSSGMIINNIANSLTYEPSEYIDKAHLIYTFKEPFQLIRPPISNEDNPVLILDFFNTYTPFSYSVLLKDIQGKTWESSQFKVNKNQVCTINLKTDDISQSDIDFKSIKNLYIFFNSMNNPNKICFKLKPIKISAISTTNPQNIKSHDPSSNQAYNTATNTSISQTFTTKPSTTDQHHSFYRSEPQPSRTSTAENNHFFPKTTSDNKNVNNHEKIGQKVSENIASTSENLDKEEIIYQFYDHSKTPVQVQRKLANNITIDPITDIISYQYDEKDTLNIISPQVRYEYFPYLNLTQFINQFHHTAETSNDQRLQPKFNIIFSEIREPFGFKMRITDTKNKYWICPWIYHFSAEKEKMYEIVPYNYGLRENYIDFSCIKSINFTFTPLSKSESTYFNFKPPEIRLGTYKIEKPIKSKSSFNNTENSLDQINRYFVFSKAKKQYINISNNELVCNYTKENNKTKDYPTINYTFEFPLNVIQSPILTEKEVAFQIEFSKVTTPLLFELISEDTEENSWSSPWFTCYENQTISSINPWENGLRENYIDFNKLKFLEFSFNP